MNYDNSFTFPLFGGLGNQLFQYFAGKMISEKTGRKLKFEVSHSSLRKSSNNSAAILDFDFTNDDEFAIEMRSIYVQKFISLALRNSANTEIKGMVQRKFCQTMLSLCNYSSHEKLKCFISDDLGFVNLESINDYNYVIGYFQSFRFFSLLASRDSSIKSKIQSSINKLSIEFEDISNEDVIIHVRRGDYIGNRFGILSDSYYISALKELEKLRNIGKIYAISDDVHLNLQNVSDSLNREIQVIPSLEMKASSLVALISRFNSIVVANSSLSWWGATFGAMISDSINIIAPKPWFKDISEPKSIISPNWQTISGDIWQK